MERFDKPAAASGNGSSALLDALRFTAQKMPLKIYAASKPEAWRMVENTHQNRYKKRIF